MSLGYWRYSQGRRYWLSPCYGPFSPACHPRLRYRPCGGRAPVLLLLECAYLILLVRGRGTPLASPVALLVLVSLVGDGAALSAVQAAAVWGIVTAIRAGELLWCQRIKAARGRSVERPVAGHGLPAVLPVVHHWQKVALGRRGGRTGHRGTGSGQAPTSAGAGAREPVGVLPLLGGPPASSPAPAGPG